MKLRILYYLTFVLIGTKLLGQAKLSLDYNVNGNVDGVIYLINPLLDRIGINQDTLREMQKSDFSYLSHPGSYKLVYRFSINNKVDSVDYLFDLNGEETDVEVNLRLNQDQQWKWEKKGSTVKEEVGKGFISVVKYYKSPPFIYVTLESRESNEDVKGPFFRLHNNSKATIYGEFLPGYFWGSLYIKLDSVNWGRKRTGIIDTEFVSQAPLSPDSSRIATVGSFGLLKKLPQGMFRYELLYSTVDRYSHGYRLYKNNSNIRWWVATKEFYRLIYDFAIK